MIVLSLMLFVGGQMMAQTHGTMFLGASFPMGDFANVNGYYSTAIFGNGNQTLGGAGLGFNAGLKWDFGVGVPGLAVLFSVDGIYNGPSSAMKKLYKEHEDELDLLNNDVKQTTSKYINVSVMVGLRYTFYITPQFGIYAEGAAGGDARFITKHEMNYKNLLGIRCVDTEKFNTAFMFAWQAGLGLEVSKNFVLGCSYYDLGKADVTGTQTTKIGSDSLTNEFGRGTLQSRMLLARIGFRF